LIQITPQMRVLVAVEPVDFRRGIDGLMRICQELLRSDPFSGCVFVFRSQGGRAIKLLVYDGQGFWLCYMRLSQGRFRHWPKGDGTSVGLLAHELQVLLCCGNPAATQVPAAWRTVAGHS
jgi:transposase